MASEKRFYFVGRPGGQIKHRHYGKLIEGEKTECGIRVQPGWLYGPKLQKFTQVCGRCQRVAGKGSL